MRGDRTHPESARATPEAPVQRASSELSLNLGILIDDEVTGAVGPGHPTGERPSRLPGNILEGQNQVAAGIKPVSEPVKQSPDTGKSEQITAESLCDATVGTTGTTGAASSIPTLVSCSGPGDSSGVGRVPAMIPGFSVDKEFVSAPDKGTLSDKENVLPSAKKSVSQFEHVDDEYFDDDYAVCSEMLNERSMYLSLIHI